MGFKLITYLKNKQIKTVFSGEFDGYTVSTAPISFWISGFRTKVKYDLSAIDPDDEIYELWSLDSKTLTCALINHIALAKLVLNEEPIDWNEELIEINSPKSLVSSLQISYPKYFPSFKSTYSKAILALSNMNPTVK